MFFKAWTAFETAPAEDAVAKKEDCGTSPAVAKRRFTKKVCEYDDVSFILCSLLLYMSLPMDYYY
jgi:hypothetical protein